MKKPVVSEKGTREEAARASSLLAMLRSSPIPEAELMSNVGLYVRRQDYSRFLFLNMIHERIIPVHGVVMEFGVRWGQGMALFTTLRSIHEPFNYNRKVIGFDTFSGFPHTAPEDGDESYKKPGAYSVTHEYESRLARLLELHEADSPISHIRKHEIVRGDACIEFPRYLARNSHTVIALAYFDFDPYKPTRDCLALVLKRVTKGSIIAFDEINVSEFPGETQAVMEVMGLDRFALRRTPFSSTKSHVVVE